MNHVRGTSNLATNHKNQSHRDGMAFDAGIAYKVDPCSPGEEAFCLVANAETVSGHSRLAVANGGGRRAKKEKVETNCLPRLHGRNFLAVAAAVRETGGSFLPCCIGRITAPASGNSSVISRPGRPGSGPGSLGSKWEVVFPNDPQVLACICNQSPGTTAKPIFPDGPPYAIWKAEHPL